MRALFGYIDCAKRRKTAVDVCHVWVGAAYQLYDVRQTPVGIPAQPHRLLRSARASFTDCMCGTGFLQCSSAGPAETFNACEVSRPAMASRHIMQMCSRAASVMWWPHDTTP